MASDLDERDRRHNQWREEAAQEDEDTSGADVVLTEEEVYDLQALTSDTHPDPTSMQGDHNMVGDAGGGVDRKVDRLKIVAESGSYPPGLVESSISNLKGYIKAAARASEAGTFSPMKLSEILDCSKAIRDAKKKSATPAELAKAQSCRQRLKNGTGRVLNPEASICGELADIALRAAQDNARVDTGAMKASLTAHCGGLEVGITGGVDYYSVYASEMEGPAADAVASAMPGIIDKHTDRIINDILDR